RPLQLGSDLLVDVMFASDPRYDPTQSAFAFQQGALYLFDGSTGALKRTFYTPFPLDGAPPLPDGTNQYGVSAGNRDMLSAIALIGPAPDVLSGAMFKSDPFGTGLDWIFRQGAAFVFDPRTVDPSTGGAALLHTFPNPGPFLDPTTSHASDIF